MRVLDSGIIKRLDRYARVRNRY